MLNMASVHKFKSYQRQRRHEIGEEIEMISFRNELSSQRESIQMSLRHRNKLQMEKNTLCMAFALSSISILWRIFFIVSYIYFFYFNSFTASLVIALISFLIHTLEPILSIFIFYSFNQMFYDEFKKKINI
jgi:hypothetical protein